MENLVTIHTLPNLKDTAALAELAAQTGKRFKLVEFEDSPEAQKTIAKKFHDISNAIQSLRFAVDAVKDGYRFDDSAAEKKIAVIEESVRTLESEMAILKQLYSSRG